jgi:hypothetical protein
VLAKSTGIDDLRIAEYPGLLGIDSAEQIRTKFEAKVLTAIVDGLTKETGTGTGSRAQVTRRPEDIVYAGTLEEVNDYFQKQEWNDGLAIIPPTLERVSEFLKFTDLAPDEEVGILPPSNMRAVPLNIAANAIMAGCKPEHMPILIAAVQALSEDKCNLYNAGSTSGIVPFLIVNGPIVREVNIECGGQLISRGANPAIGRAVGLMVKNIAGFRPGENYMGTFGYPLVFTLAEDDEMTPWEPFHVDQGFSKHANTVTVGVTNNWGPTSEPSTTPDKTAAEVALELLCREIPKKFRLYDFPTIGPKAETVMVTLVISPSIAHLVADAGYTKQMVREHVYENARMPLREFDWITTYTFPRGLTARQKAEAGLLPAEFMGAPDDMVRILKGPEILHIVVCGDPNRNRLMSFEGGHTVPTTREIQLPVNWNVLLSERAK